MLKYIEEILLPFDDCFMRRTTFRWFVIAVVGFMLRGDHLGVTSIIRDLSLDPSCYELLIHFFHSTAWDPSCVRRKWHEVLSRKAPCWKVAGKTVLVGDGVKQYKEAFRMAGVKKLFQESDNSSKPEYIFGHLLGAVGLLAGDAAHCFCIPLKMNIQDGLRSAAGWRGSRIPDSTHVVQMVECGIEAADTFGHCIFLLDRYFLSVPALRRLGEWNRKQAGGKSLEIVTKAKSSCTAYLKPDPPSGKKPGRPRKKGDSLKLFPLFEARKKDFEEAGVRMYGETKTVQYLSLDLLWGQGLYQELRFVLVKYDGVKSILASTDLTLEPVQIIELYARRAKIEDCFREFKQAVGGFCYHFWTKSLPKLNHFSKNGDPDPLSQVTDEHAREKVLNNIHAIEGFVLFANIAMGILQLISLSEMDAESVRKLRYLRTPSRKNPSEATVMYYLRNNIFSLLLKSPDSPITEIIRARQTRQRDVSAKKTG